jgi:hypothetical protein
MSHRRVNKKSEKTMTENIAGVLDPPISPIVIELKECVESIHPWTDWKEYLDLLIVTGQYHNEYGENPRTSDLADVLRFSNDKVRRRAETMESRYIRINRPAHNRAFITIDSQRYWDFNRLEDEFDSILEDLEEFLAQYLQETSDNDLRTTISTLHTEILEYREDDLFKAVSKYHTLIQELNRSGVEHNLLDAQVKNMTNRYILTPEGEEVFSAWQRREFHETQPGLFDGTYPGH